MVAVRIGSIWLVVDRLRRERERFGSLLPKFLNGALSITTWAQKWRFWPWLASSMAIPGLGLH